MTAQPSWLPFSETEVTLPEVFIAAIEEEVERRYKERGWGRMSLLEEVMREVETWRNGLTDDRTA